MRPRSIGCLFYITILLLGLFFSPVLAGETCSGEKCEAEARAWIDGEYAKEYLKLVEMQEQASWDYNTNIKAETQKVLMKARAKAARFKESVQKENIDKYDYQKFKDEKLKRRFEIIDGLGTAALSPERLDIYNNLVSNMSGLYAAAKVCPFHNQNCDLRKDGLTLEPDLENILEDSPDKSWEELVWVWESWRDQTGRKGRQDYMDFVDVSNEAARRNGYTDAGEMLLHSYVKDLDKGSDFKSDLEEVWKKMKPFYIDLHAYVRWKLRSFWGKDKMKDEKAPIPAHLLGNMWSQHWGEIFDMVEPYPDVSSPFDEVDENLKSQNYTIWNMLDISNNFYKNLGLEDMTMCYESPCSKENTPENHQCVSNHPMIEKPNWDVMCHASAWNMMKPSNNDFRLKLCAKTTFKQLVTFHHEMGHIQYYIQMKNLPLEFHDAANHGFHEAIGDTMALSVQTPEHMRSIGLVKNYQQSKKADINYLLKSAMDKVAFLPFAYTVDKYRWALYNSSISPQKMTYKWWELREKYQGINPPVMRTEKDFDPLAKYHVAANTPYIRYFFSFILEFELYKSLCLESGNYDPKDPSKPLHLCDFSHGSLARKAGTKMKRLLEKGSSEPWPQTLEEMTGGRKLDSGAILEYYKPLQDWLDKELTDNQVYRGWDSQYEEWISS